MTLVLTLLPSIIREATEVFAKGFCVLQLCSSWDTFLNTFSVSLFDFSRTGCWKWLLCCAGLSVFQKLILACKVDIKLSAIPLTSHPTQFGHSHTTLLKDPAMCLCSGLCCIACVQCLWPSHSPLLACSSFFKTRVFLQDFKVSSTPSLGGCNKPPFCFWIEVSVFQIYVFPFPSLYLDTMSWIYNMNISWIWIYNRFLSKTEKFEGHSYILGVLLQGKGALCLIGPLG